jgi:hypothetical protein
MYCPCYKHISHRQCFVARCLRQANIFGFRCISLLSSYPEASDVGETHGLVPTTVQSEGKAGIRTTLEVLSLHVQFSTPLKIQC